MKDFHKKLLTILVGTIFGIFISTQFRGCEKCPQINNTEVDTLIVHHTDTIKTSHIDTVYVTSENKIADFESSKIDTSLNTYSYYFNEDDLQATVDVKSNCQIDSIKLNYKTICPEITKTDSIIINNIDSIFVTKTNYVEDKKHKFYLGTSAGFQRDNGISGTSFNATWQFPNKYQVYYEFGVSFNENNLLNEHRVGIKIPISFAGKK